MSEAQFRPVLYLKDKCPFCLKTLIFLTESGQLSRFDIQKFAPGDAQEQSMKDELAPHFDKVTYPAAQIAPGVFMKDSDTLIAHYAAETKTDTAQMPVLNWYVSGPLQQLFELYKENMELKKRLA
jgi:hypothetical protein